MFSIYTLFNFTYPKHLSPSLFPPTPPNKKKNSDLKIWRIEQFKVKEWPKDQYGKFFTGDSYIILYTYQKPGGEALLHDIHFWLGKETSQDEAGTAAYKTVELDDFLGTLPVQYREVEGFESQSFLRHFPQMTVVCIPFY